jgi:hypothetical protein
MDDITINGINYLDYPKPKKEHKFSNLDEKEITNSESNIMWNSLIKEPKDINKYNSNLSKSLSYHYKSETNCIYDTKTELEYRNIKTHIPDNLIARIPNIKI